MSIDDCLETKRLSDGTVLKLKSWISDAINPGQPMYQLIWEDRGLALPFPINYENFTEEQIRGFYGRINSKEDFMRIKREK